MGEEVREAEVEGLVGSGRDMVGDGNVGENGK